MLREVLTVSALILAVLLVRAIFKNRVPKRMVYTLWLVVLVKLCLPGTLVSLLCSGLCAALRAMGKTAYLLPSAGGRGSARKATDGDADLSDRLGGRECAAWTLVIWYMAGIYGSAS